MSSHEQEKCLACQGSGKCLRCLGKGHLVHSSVAAIPVVSGKVQGKSETRRTCPKCLGSGTCQTCKGTGAATSGGGVGS